MIKIQPAYSRILKSEGAEWIRLEMPPAGIGSAGGALIFAALVWSGLMIWAGIVALSSEALPFAVMAAIAMVPGLLGLFAGAILCRRCWAIERSAVRLLFERRGLFRRSRRSWNVQDVSTLYTERVITGEDTAPGAVLILAFRNGRSEDVVQGKSEEEMEWVAALLSDPRGPRRVVSHAPLQTPATPRVRADESIVPASLRCRKDEGGVDLSFLALLHFRRRWWKLLGGTLLATLAILGGSALLARLGAASPGLTRIALGTLLLFVCARMLILSRTAIVRIRDGGVTIVQNQRRAQHQFPAEEIEFIQTFRGSGETELQFLLRGKPKLRLFHGRPADELEWAARFLRVALKAKADEAAPLLVDARAGECQVCGETMESRVVFCAKCRTPHHEECWSYVGQCSTYGCREIRFTRT
jgi:hypothetical protein